MKKSLVSWIPRIIAILAIAFLALFSLDSFEGDEPVSRKLLGFLMHNIPALILVAATVIAWRWELIGGILFIASFLAGSWLFRSFQGNPASLIVIAPVLAAGVLFVISFVRSRKSRATAAATGGGILPASEEVVFRGRTGSHGGSSGPG